MTDKEQRAKELAASCEATNDEFGHGYRKGLEDGYIIGAGKQEALDDAHIKELESLVELTASVMGIGTKWFSLAAKMDATIELREKLRKYYE